MAQIQKQKVRLTDLLRDTIKDLRKTYNKRGDVLSKELDRGASYVSQLENGKIRDIEFDLLDFHKYKELEKQISKSVNGTWDCLINNVSIINRKSFLTTDVDDLDKVFDLNLKSVILISQIFAKNNIKNKTAGNIINISSVASIEYSNSEKQFSYSLSKSLLNNLTKFLGASLGKYHICVNCLVLGNLSFGMTKKDRSDSEFNTLISNTKLNTPTNSIVSKSSIIESFSFLLHCNFDFTGNIIFLDGGYSL